ncbi:TIGR00529 family membrane protein [Thermococcus sp. M39]|uniref:TIGR00529 family membrane protein n=1 Tax=unclassified Thermococcus TaxID=2627626 RepID=UPI00143BC998|nr:MULTISPECIES: TIGR00529 family membrane protein [unclassified Thermococcus]NJE07021.1 TIGR00529 family membrane protein [Thermococcus sp. M39]NJE12921.1 TIGR00529 family membrane protein [Thermococcus sp. LS2]
MIEVLKLLVTFAFVIILIRLKVHVGISIFAGSVLLGILFGLTPLELIKAFYYSSTAWSTVRLILIIVFIMAMTNIFSQIGYLKNMEKAIKELFPKAKYSLAMLPALIGLMPMPAGALVSAPMIEEVANKLNLKPEEKTVVNYWFRHVWEFSWPMYQAIIIASAILGIAVREFSTKMFPLTILMIIIGYILLLKPISDETSEIGNRKEGAKLLLKATYPILVIILISIVLGYDMVYGALVGFLSTLLPHFKKLDKKQILKHGTQPKIIFLLLAVMYFKYILQTTGAVSALPKAIIQLNLPVTFVITLTPFIVGLMTGISFAYVGMAFPLLLPFFTSFDKIALAYLSGYMGMLFSPVHLCLVFSAEYYKAELERVYRKLLVPGAVLFILGVIYTILLR